jgi:signal transduction histidine kinase/CHASE3 domain sensor protein
MMNIGTKLGLGIGVLIVLCVVIGLVSYTQTGAVNEKLEELTQVREPVNSAVYGLENDLAETAFASLAYSATGDTRVLEPIKRVGLEKDSSMRSDNSTENLARLAGLRADVRDEIIRFHEAAMYQVNARDQQVRNMSKLLGQLQAIDALLSDRILKSISVENPIAYRRLQVALSMQVQMNALAKSLGNYMQTGEMLYADQLNTAEREFTEFLRLYQVVVLSPEEKNWADELQKRSDEGLNLARNVIDMEKSRRLQLGAFMQNYRDLASTLNDRVQIRTERGLSKAKEELLEAGRSTNTTILIVLIVSLIFGILAGVWTTHSITRRLEHLTSVMTSVGQGDRARRVKLTGGDELKLMGDTFNAMVDQLEQAERDRNAGLRQFASSMQRAQEDERARISRELHDDLCQRLTGMKFRVEVLEDEAMPVDRKVAKQLRDVREELDRSIVEVRRISSNLRPSVLDDFGLITALRLLGKEFEKQHSIPVEVICSESMPADMPGDCEIAMYRIAQEALANVAKHARAFSVDLSLTADEGSIVLKIHDNGRGMDDNVATRMRVPGHGLGMLGMRERAELLGGSFAVDSSYDRGTSITVAIPLHLEDQHA